MFASTAATRLFVEPDSNLISFMQQVAKEQSAILRHQKYPYNQLISADSSARLRSNEYAEQSKFLRS